MAILIIAEIGSVHDGNFDMAKKLIDTAKSCGADIVKFQTHIAAAETLRDAPMPPYFKGEPRYEYFERTGFSEAQWKQLKQYCDKKGIEFMSSPFSIEAAHMLSKLGMKRFKIPSGEVTNIPLLEEIAKTKKPVIISSGMSSWTELDRAVRTIKKVHKNITVLQCTTEYPCPYDQVGLNLITEMQARYKLPVGFSDHTLTSYAPFAATMMGITVLEKHLTISRSMYGSDAKHSLEPHEFKEMVEGIRAIETMRVSKVSMASAAKYKQMKVIFEKSIVPSRLIPKGTVITKAMLAYKKPGSGIPAADYAKVVGKRAARDLQPDTLLKKSDLR